MSFLYSRKSGLDEGPPKKNLSLRNENIFMKLQNEDE